MISNPWLEEFWQWKFNCSLLQKDLPHKNKCTGANDDDDDEDEDDGDNQYCEADNDVVFNLIYIVTI